MPANRVVHRELMSPSARLGDQPPARHRQPDKPEPWPGNMALYSAIHVQEQKVPGMGKFALFTDPEGRMMGLWRPKTP